MFGPVYINPEYVEWINQHKEIWIILMAYISYRNIKKLKQWEKDD